MEETSGEDLTEFFDSGFCVPGQPDLKITAGKEKMA